MYEIYELEDVTENNSSFTISDDKTADWACKIIKQNEEELNRLTQVIDEEIEILKNKKDRLKSQYANKSSYLKGLLADYFETVEKRELKTCFKYKLPSGELVFCKPSIKYERDDEKILQYLIDNNKFEYVKVKQSVDWQALKDNENIEQVPGVTKVDVPAEFKVK